MENGLVRQRLTQVERERDDASEGAVQWEQEYGNRAAKDRDAAWHAKLSRVEASRKRLKVQIEAKEVQSAEQSKQAGERIRDLEIRLEHATSSLENAITEATRAKDLSTRLAIQMTESENLRRETGVHSESQMSQLSRELARIQGEREALIADSQRAKARELEVSVLSSDGGDFSSIYTDGATNSCTRSSRDGAAFYRLGSSRECRTC